MKFWSALKFGIKSPVTTGRRVADALELRSRMSYFGGDLEAVFTTALKGKEIMVISRLEVLRSLDKSGNADSSGEK